MRLGGPHLANPTQVVNVSIAIADLTRVYVFCVRKRQLVFLHLKEAAGAMLKEVLGMERGETIVTIIPEVTKMERAKSKLEATTRKWVGKFQKYFGQLVQEIDLPHANAILSQTKSKSITKLVVQPAALAEDLAKKQLKQKLSSTNEIIMNVLKKEYSEK